MTKKMVYINFLTLNLYPVDSTISGFPYTNPLDSDLSSE